MIAKADDHSIGRAVELLRAGKLVAIPTETVYGLAGDASNREAVERIFAAKGRPADHPLIVHLAGIGQLDDWAIDIPDSARRLAEAFWPGPLTMILGRHPSVLPAVTGGMETVAIRVPSHPVTQGLLEAFAGGLAAPSANRFGRVSPTTAADVESDLDGDVDLILDGGPCGIGLESTIVAWRGDDIVIARPGAVEASAIAEASGCRVTTAADDSVKAPGTLPSHYAPSTPIELSDPASIAGRVAELASSGARVGVLSLGPVETPAATAAWHTDGDIDEFARSLYRFLREADSLSLDLLVASLPPQTGLGLAVADRLRRAAHRS